MFSARMVQSLAPQYNYRRWGMVGVVGIAREVVVDNTGWQHNAYLKWLTLFVTSGTLLCCALPIVLVSMGFGAVIASLNYSVPGLVFLAEHKLWTLYLSALLLLFLGWVIWRPNQTCPVDPMLARHCEKTKRWNRGVFWVSVVIWIIGFFFSVLLLPLRILLSF